MGGQNPNFSALKVQGVRIKRASLKSLCPHFKLNAPYRENNRQRIVKKKSISLSAPVFLNGLSCLLSFPPPLPNLRRILCTERICRRNRREDGGGGGGKGERVSLPSSPPLKFRWRVPGKGGRHSLFFSFAPFLLSFPIRPRRRLGHIQYSWQTRVLQKRRREAKIQRRRTMKSGGGGESTSAPLAEQKTTPAEKRERAQLKLPSEEKAPKSCELLSIIYLPARHDRRAAQRMENFSWHAKRSPPFQTC